jgi:hypothetical protein
MGGRRRVDTHINRAGAGFLALAMTGLGPHRVPTVLQSKRYRDAAA